MKNKKKLSNPREGSDPYKALDTLPGVVGSTSHMLNVYEVPGLTYEALTEVTEVRRWSACEALTCPLHNIIWQKAAKREHALPAVYLPCCEVEQNLRIFGRSYRIRSVRCCGFDRSIPS